VTEKVKISAPPAKVWEKIGASCKTIPQPSPLSA